jgi:aspartate aminotransferase/aminotransferase
MHRIDASGIRKVFDLAATMKRPVNLSIGQPHFDTPQPIKDALCKAVQDGKNAYSQTQGIAPLLTVLQKDVDDRYHHPDRKIFVTSGTSGALMLALCTLINPGDEVIIFDPWFVMYRHLTTLAGGTVFRRTLISGFGSRMFARRLPRGRRSSSSTAPLIRRVPLLRRRKSRPWQNLLLRRT